MIAPSKKPADPELLKEYEYRSKITPWLTYPLTAVPAVMPWHLAEAEIKALSGPNGGGKTTAGAYGTACVACGYDPIRNIKHPTPNVQWAVCLTYKHQGRRMLRALQEMLPRNEDGSPNWQYYKQDAVIVLGKPYHSEIYIKQQEDGKEAFYGERIYRAWIDEGKAGETGQENFNEILAREDANYPLLIDITLTPENGQDWLWNRIWNEKSEDFIPGTFRHSFTLEDCLIENGGFWTRRQFDRKKELWDEHEAAARIYGRWVPFGNRSFFKMRLLMEAMKRVEEKKGVPGYFTADGFQTNDEAFGRIYRRKHSGHEYIAAWDPSSGSGGDNSAFVVLDRSDLSIVYQAFDNRTDPKLFAEMVVLPAAYAYDAKLVWEVNGEGGGVATGACSDYPNCYLWKQFDRKLAVETDKVGWRTSEITRKTVLDNLQRALREAKWDPTPEVLQDMSHMVQKQLDSGKIRVEHAQGFHDDLAFAAGIALSVHYEEPEYDWPNFASLKVRWGETHSVTQLPLTP